jgi:hypothetical protein
MTPEEAAAELVRMFSGPQPSAGKTAGTICNTTWSGSTTELWVSSGTRSTLRLSGPSPMRSKNCLVRSLRKTTERASMGRPP